MTRRATRVFRLLAVQKGQWRHAFIIFAVSIGLLSACSKKEEAPVPPTLLLAESPPVPKVLGFEVAKLTTTYGVASKEEYVAVDKLKSQPFRIAVLATWCPYSKQFLERAQKDPSMAADYLLVVYEDEFIKKVKSEEKQGNISSERANSLIDSPENKGRMVFDADEVLKFGLPIYVIKSGTLETKVNGFPTRLSCAQGVCSKAGMTLSEAKEVVRDDPGLLAKIKAGLPAAERRQAENNPDFLITGVARLIQESSEK